jgi:hypothetical protein
MRLGWIAPYCLSEMILGYLIRRTIDGRIPAERRRQYVADVAASATDLARREGERWCESTPRPPLAHRTVPVGPRRYSAALKRSALKL